MIRRLQFACFTLAMLLGCASLAEAAPGAVSGWVRDSSGAPQVGAVVQLLRPDQSVILSVFTDARGRYSFPSIFPGHYALKAMGTSFLPALRENVRVRSGTVVNLTLNTLYEVMQWLPAEPRSGNAAADDWSWTLRSAANRPLLRWLEDGPLVVVSDGAGGAPKLKARLMASGQAGTFGESGERFSATVEDTPSESRALLARVDFEPDSNAGMESMLGFRQDLGYAGSVQSVAAVMLQPEIEGAGQGLEEAGMRSGESIRLGDMLEAEAGSEQVLARFSRNAPHTLAAALPYASVDWHEGASTVSYRMSSLRPAAADREQTEARTLLPALSARAGQLAMEHGLHQEIAWERHTEASGVSVLVYADHLDNPVVEAMGRLAAGSTAASDALIDPASGLLRAAGPSFSTAGLLATFEHRLSGGSQVRLSYANGSALAMPSATAVHPTALAQILAETHPRHAQTYALSLSGTLDGTGTRWHASYRWQPEETVTEVAPFAVGALEPYLSFHIRQPLCRAANGSSRIETQFELRNLLAQGYRPFLMSDGSLLVFAQDQRSFRGGLALIF
jgi:hypothetical protein